MRLIIFRNFRRKPYKKDCKQLSICNPFYSKLLSKRIFLFCYYYVYRALANPKLLRGLTHSGFMFDDIICNFYCPLLNVIFHKNNPCINCFLQSMRGDFDVCLILIRIIFWNIFALYNANKYWFTFLESTR